MFLGQLLLVDNATYANKQGGGTVGEIDEANLLLDGAVAIFTEDGVLLTTATVLTAVATRKQFIVAVGTQSGTMYSIPVDRDAFYSAYCAYVAPVKHVVAVGFDGATGSMNFPASLVSGDIASMRVGVHAEGREPAVNWKRYEYTVKNGDVAADVVAALIVKINADDTRVADAVALGANLGIQLTAVNFDERLLTTLDEIAIDADEATNTAIVFGKGTPAQVLEAEQVSYIYEGDTNRIHYANRYWTAPSEVDSAGEYALFSFQWSTERRNSVNSDKVAMPTLTLAVGDTTIRDILITIIDTKILQRIPNTGSGGGYSPK